MISRFDIFERLFTTILAVVLPFIIYFTYPELKTISQSWITPLQPMFIITNALVSFFFFKLPKWRIPALLLLLLTAFPVCDYFVLHNIFAILFFIFSGISLLSLKKFRFYILIYIMSLFFITSGLFWVETWAIITLCLYHMHIMVYTLLISRNRPNRL